MKARSHITLLLFAVCCVPGAAFGQSVIFNNLSSPATSSVSVSSLAYQAQSFIAPATNTYLSSVTLNLRNNVGATGEFTVKVYHGLPSLPCEGNLLGTLSGPSNPGTGNIKYVSGCCLALLANHTYWVSASATAGNGQFYSWMIADTSPSIGSSVGRAIFNVGTQQWEAGPGDLGLQVQVDPVLSSGTNQVFVTLESSTNLVNWSTATNGVYGSPDEARFFRIHMEEVD